MLPNDNLRRGGALRADLLKMHAYRDAIRRETAGAYVLYPGGDDEVKGLPFTKFMNFYRVWARSCYAREAMERLAAPAQSSDFLMRCSITSLRV